MITADFETSSVGRWTEPLEMEVTRERIAEYAAATNDPTEDHREGRVAPPVFAIVPVFDALIPAALSIAPVSLIGRLVHGEQDFAFHAPIVPGLKLRTRARPLGFETKSSGTRGTIHLECRDAQTDGLVCEQWVTFFFRNVDAGRSIGELGPLHTFDEALRAKPVAARFSQSIDRDQTFRYSKAAGDPMPIHLDEDIAKASGLPGIIAHGLCTMAFVSWGLLGAFSQGEPRWVERLAVRFSKPVLPGQTIETRAWFVRQTPNGADAYAFETCVEAEPVLRDGLVVLSNRTTRSMLGTQTRARRSS